jgi:hypothetical protein
MQDGAPEHRAQATVQDLRERCITVVQWPPFSPFLSPKETVWNWMEDYNKWGDIELPYDTLRTVSTVKLGYTVLLTWSRALIEILLPERLPRFVSNSFSRHSTCNNCKTGYSSEKTK